MKTSENPADFASRGLEIKHQDYIGKWFYKSEFLWTNKTLWSDADIDVETDRDDPELKNQGRIVRRIMALVILFIEKIKHVIRKRMETFTV